MSALAYSIRNCIDWMVAGLTGGRRGGTVPQITEASDDAARIVIVIDNRDPIDLLDFTASLTGLAREHEARLRAERPGVDHDETRLVVVDVRQGSIILELLPVLAPFVSTMEITNTAANFIKHMAALIGPMKIAGGRIPDATTAQLKNLNDTVRAVAMDSDGRLNISARYKNGKVLQEIIIDKADAATIEANVEQQRSEIEDRKNIGYPRVLMRLHQSSVEDARVGKRTAEKGIVESIDMGPRPLIYASDMAGQMIKDAILTPDGNPYKKGFVVDLDVETVGGRPRAYRIIAVHDIIDLDD